MVLKIIQYYILLNWVNIFSMAVSDEERIKTKSKNEGQLKEKRRHIKLRQGLWLSLKDGISFAIKCYWPEVGICCCIYIAYGFVVPLIASFLVMLPTIIQRWFYRHLAGRRVSEMQELIIERLGQDRKIENSKLYTKCVGLLTDYLEGLHEIDRSYVNRGVMILCCVSILPILEFYPLLACAYMMYIIEIGVFVDLGMCFVLASVFWIGAILLECVHIGRYAVNKITRGSEVSLFDKPDERDFIFFKVINKLCFGVPQIVVRALWFIVSCLYEKSKELSDTVSKINRDIKQFLTHKSRF